jgi:hypothetical protein
MSSRTLADLIAPTQLSGAVLVERPQVVHMLERQPYPCRNLK